LIVGDVLTELNKSFRKVAFDLHLLRQELPVGVKTLYLTPSKASQDPKTTRDLLERLGINIEPLNIEMRLMDECPQEWPAFGFVWGETEGGDKELENSSYVPTVEYLKSCGFVAYNIANGQHLPDSLLFESDVYTLRKLDPTMNRSQQVYKIHIVSGRSDIAILTQDYIARGQPKIAKWMIKFVIEIKTTQAMRKSISIKPCWREACIQLIGLNVENDNRSPPVVMTNLKDVHYVIYLERVDQSIEEFGFQIQMQPCSSFQAAIAFASLLADRDSISAHFCRAPTPNGLEEL
jgi:hypothetical protein